VERETNLNMILETITENSDFYAPQQLNLQNDINDINQDIVEKSDSSVFS